MRPFEVDTHQSKRRTKRKSKFYSGKREFKIKPYKPDIVKKMSLKVACRLTLSRVFFLIVVFFFACVALIAVRPPKMLTINFIVFGECSLYALVRNSHIQRYSLLANIYFLYLTDNTGMHSSV